MALQIADPIVVAKVERLASETQGASDPGRGAARMAALLAQLDRVPERTDAFDPLEWDDQGLPK